MKLPNCDRVFVDMEKLRGYCLNTNHRRGQHKARVFAATLGLTVDDAEFLRDALLRAAQSCDAKLTDNRAWTVIRVRLPIKWIGWTGDGS
jgi:hypothetical protein